MFCPQCGTQATSGTSRFCRECGAEINGTSGQQARQTQSGAPGFAQTGWGTGFASPGPAIATTHVIVKHDTPRHLLMALGLLLLLPIAIPLVFGTMLAGLIAGVALIGIALKVAPLLAIGLVVYLILSRPRRMAH